MVFDTGGIEHHIEQIALGMALILVSLIYIKTRMQAHAFREPKHWEAKPPVLR